MTEHMQSDEIYGHATSFLPPSAEIHEILQTVLDQLSRVVDYDACALLLMNGDDLQIAASRGFPDGAEVEEHQLSQAEHSVLRRLIHEGKPVAWSDTTVAGPFTGDTHLEDLHAGITAPMIYRGQPIGFLQAFKKQPGYYSDKDGQVAMAMASQAAMAIENARLYSETRRRALQLEAVSQVSQKAISILEMDQLLVEVVRLIRDKLGHYHVHLFLVDGSSNEIVLRESSGHADESLKRLGLRLKIGEEGITGWVAAAGKPLLCNDVSQEPRYHSHKLLPGTQAELAVPLRLGDVMVGVLDVQSERRDAFHPDDLIALQILADQVAIAIENAHLFDRARHQIEAMQALHDISLDITSHLDVQEVLTAILRQAAHFLRAHSSSLGILDRQAGVVRLIAIHNLPPEYQGVTLQPGEGAAGYVVATGKPLIVNDYPLWAERSPIFRHSPYNAIISVPLRREEEVFGALNVIDRGERRPFREEDVHLLSLFADLVCIALKNAELYGQVRQAGEELELKVERRTEELARARQELASKADELQRLLTVTIHIQEEERTRIAQDLHDGSNQLITGTLYELQATQESIAGHRPEVALQKLEIAKGLLRRIEAENRQIISGLRPPILDAQGLAPALKWHVTGFRKHLGIACALKISGQPIRLSREAETAVYRIVQEALNNVAMHAQAQRARIKVEFRPTRLRVVIEDDGVGFDYESVFIEAPGRMGLIGMRERAQSIGGQIEVKSAPGQGTRLILAVPLSNQPESEAGVVVNPQKF